MLLENKKMYFIDGPLTQSGTSRADSESTVAKKLAIAKKLERIESTQTVAEPKDAAVALPSGWSRSPDYLVKHNLGPSGAEYNKAIDAIAKRYSGLQKQLEEKQQKPIIALSEAATGEPQQSQKKPDTTRIAMGMMLFGIREPKKATSMLGRQSAAEAILSAALTGAKQLAKKKDPLHALAASAVAVAGGLAAGAVSVVDPKAYVDTARTLYNVATSSEARKKLLESFNVAKHPLEAVANIASLVGGAVAGRAVGRVVGEAVGEAGPPKAYVLEAHEYSVVKRSVGIETRPTGVYQVAKSYGVEAGSAKRVASTGVPDAMAGEVSVRVEPIEPKGVKVTTSGWARKEPMLAIEKPGKPGVVELVAKPGAGEKPVTLFESEKLFVNGKKVLERTEVTTDIRVVEPGPLRRLIAKLSGEEPRPSYTAKNMYKKEVYLGEPGAIEAGGLAAEQLLAKAKPKPGKTVAVKPSLDLGPEGVLTGAVVAMLGKKKPGPSAIPESPLITSLAEQLEEQAESAKPEPAASTTSIADAAPAGLPGLSVAQERVGTLSDQATGAGQGAGSTHNDTTSVIDALLGGGQSSTSRQDSGNRQRGRSGQGDMQGEKDTQGGKSGQQAKQGEKNKQKDRQDSGTSTAFKPGQAGRTRIGPTPRINIIIEHPPMPLIVPKPEPKPGTSQRGKQRGKNSQDEEPITALLAGEEEKHETRMPPRLVAWTPIATPRLPVIRLPRPRIPRHTAPPRRRRIEREFWAEKLLPEIDLTQLIAKPSKSGRKKPKRSKRSRR